MKITWAALPVNLIDSKRNLLTLSTQRSDASWGSVGNRINLISEFGFNPMFIQREQSLNKHLILNFSKHLESISLRIEAQSKQLGELFIETGTRLETSLGSKFPGVSIMNWCKRESLMVIISDGDRFPIKTPCVHRLPASMETPLHSRLVVRD